MKNGTVKIVQGAVLVIAILLAACGGHGSGGGTSDASVSTADIGAAGGSLTGPDGVQVEFPPNALDQSTTIRIARSSTGAPPLPPQFQGAVGSIYEITPHDVPFNLPATIRLPIPSGATGTKVLVASPGQEWRVKNAVVIDGMSVMDRSSFSWFTIYTCSAALVAIDACYWNMGVTSLNATPLQALIQTSPRLFKNGFFYGSNGEGGAGSFRVDGATMLHFRLEFSYNVNCHSNATVTLLRGKRTSPTDLDLIPIKTKSVAMAPSAVSNDLLGSAVIDLPFTSQNNGENVFYLDVEAECPALAGTSSNPYWDLSNYQLESGGHDPTVVIGNITTPTVFNTVGGSVTGLKGAGLVLQNNGGDDMPVSTDGPFTFATSIAEGFAYDVRVKTQPADQNCTVQNGSGTAQANVTNVAVSCVDLPVVINPVNPSAYGCSRDTVTFTASKGTPPYTWSTNPVSGLTVINATQAQWKDSHDQFCSPGGGSVTVTVMDSVGATVSTDLTVLY